MRATLRLLVVLPLSFAPAAIVQDPAPTDGPAASSRAQARFSEDGWIEYVPGDAPLILAAPHGGSRRPTGIEDRRSGVLLKDARTLELAREIANAFERRTGHRPHVVLCHLHRSKLDANRDRADAAQGDASALVAWRAWHAMLDEAKSAVVEAHGRGVLIDVHGQTHAEGWIEWGYALTRNELARADGELDDDAVVSRVSVRTLASERGNRLAELLRGPASLGGLAEAAGYSSVPSPTHPHPGQGNYFNGGYNTRRHGSRSGGEIDAIQMEVPRHLRSDDVRRARLAADAAAMLGSFLERWYGYEPSRAARTTGAMAADR